MLTRVDKLEDKISMMIRKGQVAPADKEKVLKELQDIKIESVVSKLSIPRGSVHFIENYTDDGRLSIIETSSRT